MSALLAVDPGYENSNTSVKRSHGHADDAVARKDEWGAVYSGYRQLAKKLDKGQESKARLGFS